MKFKTLNLPATIVALFVLSFSATASDLDSEKTVYFQPTPYKDKNIYCKNDSDISPAKNDFELIDYSIMNSNEGERFALVTIKNSSSGQRLFSQEHIVAILGDCLRKNR